MPGPLHCVKPLLKIAPAWKFTPPNCAGTMLAMPPGIEPMSLSAFWFTKLANVGVLLKPRSGVSDRGTCRKNPLSGDRSN